MNINGQCQQVRHGWTHISKLNPFHRISYKSNACEYMDDVEFRQFSLALRL